MSEQLYQDNSSRERPGALAQVKAVVAIASATGGTGKSTLAANLALVLALKKRKVGIVDANFETPAIATMLGVARVTMLDVGGALEPASGPMGIRLIANDPEANRAPISFADDPFTQPLNGSEHALGFGQELSLESILEKARLGALDILLLDTPAGFSHLASLASRLPEPGVVLVTTPSALCVTATRRVLTQARSAGIRILGLVENMQSFYCGSCQSVRPLLPRTDVAGLARDFDVPVLGRLPFDFRLAECCDRGRVFTREYPDAPLTKLLNELAQNLLAALNVATAGEAVATISTAQR